jgi:hypothetical protein
MTHDERLPRPLAPSTRTGPPRAHIRPEGFLRAPATTAVVALATLGALGMVLAGGLASTFGDATALPSAGGLASLSALSTSATCPNAYYYHSGSHLSLAQVVACAKDAGFAGAVIITFVSMAYQESSFCPGAIESGGGACSDQSPGCHGQPNAEGILQEGTGGQCPPTGGAFSVSGYSPGSCTSYKAHGWGGVYFNPTCAFKWAHAYYRDYGYGFWGSYLSGAYCKWAPNGFHGTGSVKCSGSGQNQAGLPWSSVCPGNKC